MPEIKNTFTQGKMNKDLDERLIPKGQYIDAMNVEVTTSEDSDVGTVQNIYGNLGITGNNLIPSENVCVGSVVDQETNSVFWLTAADKSIDTRVIPENNIENRSNIIFRHNKNNTPLVDPIFIDIHQIKMGRNIVTDQNIADSIIFLPIQNNIRVGMSIRVWSSNTSISMGTVTFIGDNPFGGYPNTVMISVSNGYDLFNNQWDYIEFNQKTTGWNTNTLITGINIVDDMLFWTDNESEPKKINITRSKEGTIEYGDITDIEHTDLIINGINEGPVKEEHITVIRPKPTSKVTLDMKSIVDTQAGTRGYLQWHGRITSSGSDIVKVGDQKAFTTIISLDTVSFNNENAFDFNIGDIILLKQTTSTQNENFPITDYHIKARIYNIIVNTFGSPADIRIKILDVNYQGYPDKNTTTAVDRNWIVQKQLNKNGLFELKFPRFSYRWKFEDGEYSTFAPWSNITFLPSEFNWQSKEGFNLGMVNNLAELTILDFIPVNTPKDIVQVDILYREADSPNVYIVDSLKQDDTPPVGLSSNAWNSAGSQGVRTNLLHANLPQGKYKITSETIFATVAPNQTLRNWDAVPRKALAQEIIGNRLVYANYERNFNLASSPYSTFQQDLTISHRSYNNNTWNKKSVKTLREYQIGVAYIDSYGRETPVFTNNDSVVNIPKLHSSKSNILYSKINHLAPAGAKSYKFYVKENSSKYYNLVMDRWYDADDGNIWLSFNSHDRNKVDEETYLHLKRGHDGTPVSDNYKYKILSIENEAPEFVRNIRKQFGIKPNDPTDTNTWSVSSLPTWWGTGDKVFPSANSFPKVGEKTFTIKKEIIDNSSWNFLNFSGFEVNTRNRIRFLKYANNVTAEHRDNGTFSFNEEPEKASDWYKIDKINAIGGDYIVNLGKKLGNDCFFVANSAGTAIENYVAIEIAEERAENLPEFDGRFFVKVLRDKTVEDRVIGITPTTAIVSQPLFFLNQPTHTGTTGTTWNDPNSVGLQFYKDETNGSMSPATSSTLLSVKSQWQSYFGDGTVLNAGNTNGPKWFIDELKYSGSMWGSGMAPSGIPGWFPPFQLTDGTPGAGDGINNTNKTIDISFSGHQHSISYSWPNGTSVIDYNNSLIYSSNWFGNLIGGSENPTGWNSPHSTSDILVDNFQVGKTFRFSEDTDNTIYNIIKVDIFNRWNYLDEDLWENGITDYNTNSPTGLFHNLQELTTTADNRRISFRLHLNKEIGANAGYNPTDSDCSKNTSNCSIEFVNSSAIDDVEKTSSDPAVWETEPKETSDLDVYYEASQSYPLRLNIENISNIFGIGDIVRAVPGQGIDLNTVTGKEAVITGFHGYYDGGIILGNIANSTDFNLPPGKPIRIHKKDNEAHYIELVSQGLIGTGNFNSSNNTIEISVNINTHKWGRTLNWFNAYSFGNGIESDTIRDDFNQIEIGNGITASTTVGWQYEEERLKNGLIFSGLYNAKTGLNDLNQFIEAENITKDTNPSYGSIQKLHARDSDLVAFCEDKVLKILASKDALYNADENPNLISSTNVLGQVLPFIGDYGISTNPESFAKENFRSYFTDRKRGAVLRLSRDGITPISENGMKDWFRDRFKNEDQRIHGSYDTHKSHYNVSLQTENTTVVFNESSKGWTSFRSFVPESGQSMNNDYYTFKGGKIFQHHIGPINTFYGDPVDSTLGFVFNEAPSIVKSFTTINYEGTQSKVSARDDDDQYINLTQKNGWYVSNIQTDKQEGKVNEFIEKEGKWFNYITGPTTTLENIDTREFSFQGISSLSSTAQLITGALYYGCELGTTNIAGNTINILEGNCDDVIGVPEE